MISYHLLSWASQCKCVSYIRVARLMLNQKKVLPLIEKLSKKGAGTRNLGVTHVDCATIHSSSRVDVKLMPPAADGFVNNPVTPFLFHSGSLYKRVHLFLQDLQHSHHSRARCSGISFLEFLQAIPCKSRFLLKTSKMVNLERDTTSHTALIRKKAHQ